MHKKSNKYKYYFSDTLKEKLNQISDYPLTIVEAPSGFGKTTAVSEYLKKKLPKAACVYWYTSLGEPASMAWIGICELFSSVNMKVADDLKNLKMPTMDTLFYMKVILRNLNCQKETYLIIDNFQLVDCNIPWELIHIFSMHGNSKLHMIFITQQLETRQQLSIHNNNIHKIETSTFFFDREGIANLFRMEGLRLTEDELEKIFKSTEGWISAIRLEMINFKETDFFAYSAGIEQLVETAIWNRLAPIEQDFLLKVSVFDSFTARQAVAMLEYDITPDKIERVIRNIDFIRYHPDKRSFIIHSILLDYLRNRFYYYQTEEYQNQVFHKAGVSCVVMKQYYPAAEFFYKVKDFDAILSLPFTRKYLDVEKEKCDKELLVTIISRCPEETLCKYPFTMITFGYYMLLDGKYEIYKKLCGLIRRIVQRENNFSQEEIRKIRGEYIILESLGEFNDISKMQEGFKTAWEIFRKSSDMIENSAPWLSVFPTTYGIFWREPGTLDQTLKIIDEIKPIYRKFSRGQAAGLNYVMRAEVMLVRGEDNEAEILCYKALYEARSYRQYNICLYAELNIARIFILRGDRKKFFTAIRNIQEYAKENSDLSIHRMVDLCMSRISLWLGIKDYVAPWIYDMKSINKSLYVSVIPFAQIYHLRLLLMDKRYNEFYAVSQLALNTLNNLDGNIKYLLPKMYYLIFLAAAKHNNGNDVEALRYLKEAIDIGLPDKVYLPFAEHESIVNLLTRLNIYSIDGVNNAEAPTNMPKCSSIPPAKAVNGIQNSGDSISALINLCKRQAKGVSIIRKAILQDKSPLTPREREVAQLAKDRISSKEIAEKLHISEATVKTILRNVYSKLDIHSRRELALKEF